MKEHGLKIVFLGTPEFAVPTLKALIESRHEVVAVVSQPDRAKDRKGRLLPTPVKACATENGLPVFAFEKIRVDGVKTLKSFGADVFITAAYGQILSKEILDIAPYGVINVHASLLPKLRGSAPIQWAIIDGEQETGVTIMQTDVGIDDGMILSAEKTAIGETETAGELSERLSAIGARLLLKTLDKLEKGELRAVRQNEAEATRCRMITKNDGHLDFSETAEAVGRRCRGVTPAPGAFVYIGDDTVKIGRVGVISGDFGKCGVSFVRDGKIIVACKEGGIVIERLQLSGGKMMTAEEYLRGRKWTDGTELR